MLLARTPYIRQLLARVHEDRLLLVLLLALPILLWLVPSNVVSLFHLVEWHTVTALAGLMVLSRGLEDSGYLARLAAWLLGHQHSQRVLAFILVVFAALLSAVITNDVALFVLIPICLSLARISDIKLGRLVIFLALAVNAGSAMSPVGNPQNLLLWQASGMSFIEFTRMMLPLAAPLTLFIGLLALLAFPAAPLNFTATDTSPRHKALFRWSLFGYVPMILAIELGVGPLAAICVCALYALRARTVLRSIDWWLLLIFVLMFIDLGLLAQLDSMQYLAQWLLTLPGEALSAGALLSQGMSNVPAAIFLQNFTQDWRGLSWGVTVGGFGFAIGSLANLIALRLARQPNMWLAFHLWSVPIFLISLAFAAWLLH